MLWPPCFLPHLLTALWAHLRIWCSKDFGRSFVYCHHLSENAVFYFLPVILSLMSSVGWRFCLSSSLWGPCVSNSAWHMGVVGGPVGEGVNERWECGAVVIAACWGVLSELRRARGNSWEHSFIVGKPFPLTYTSTYPPDHRNFSSDCGSATSTLTVPSDLLPSFPLVWVC